MDVCVVVLFLLTNLFNDCVCDLCISKQTLIFVYFSCIFKVQQVKVLEKLKIDLYFTHS